MTTDDQPLPAAAAPAPSTRNWLAVRLRAVEPQTLTVSLLPALIAMAAAMGTLPMGRWPWDLVVLCALGVTCLQATANLINDYFDFRHGVDQHVGTEGRLSGWALGRGDMRPPQVLALALAFLVVALACGGYIAFRRGPEVLAMAAAGVAVLYSYTGPPLKLKHHALGEVAVFLVFGPGIMLSAAYVVSGEFCLLAALLCVPVGLATTAVLMGNNLRDADVDRRAGVFTIAHIAGGRLLRAAYVAAELACVGLLAVYAAIGLAPKWLLACPLALVLLAAPLQAVWRNQRRLDIVELTARFEAGLLAFVLLAMLLCR
jgi:1,4-dihydroxy-2-naphthoate octaprenyltransferase